MFKHLAVKHTLYMYFDEILRNSVLFNHICFYRPFWLSLCVRGYFMLNSLDELYYANLIYQTVHGRESHDSAKHLKLHVTVKILFT